MFAEIRAACRDPGTQWMVYACGAIYFITFTALLKRGARSAERGTAFNPQFPGSDTSSGSATFSPADAEKEMTRKPTPDPSREGNSERETRSPKQPRIHQPATFNFSNPDWWLCALVLIASLHYAFNYATASGSTQALMLIAGAAIGKGARLWVEWGVEQGNLEPRTLNIEPRTAGEPTPDPSQEGNWEKAESGKASTTEHTKGSTENFQPSTFNPQLFQTPSTINHQPGARIHLLLTILLLLLATASVWHPESAMQFQYRGLNRWSGPWDNPNIFGLLMGVGVVLGVGFAVSSFKLQVESSMSWKRWAWLVFLVACIVCCGIGLLKSYSRGAWLGAAGGLAMLAYQASRFQVSSSCGLCVSWLRRNWMPCSILLAAILVLCFWQFRHTEFHPVRRAFSVGNQNDFSWRNRVAAWEGALAMMADKPLAGFGWNQPERIYDQIYRPPKVSEGMAIQLNHYFILGMSLGLPALVCFLAYLGLSLTRNGERGTRNGSSCDPPIVIFHPRWICSSAAVVLLVGLWFDGGLFNLATASVFWVLLEVGRVTLCAPGWETLKSSPSGLPPPLDAAPRNSCASWSCRFAVPIFVASLLLTSLAWAKSRDPFHREWMSLRTSDGQAVSAVAVIPDRSGPFPVVVWCHGAGGSAEGSGETLRQFAALGLAAVGFEYDQTNQAGFDAQFVAVMEAVEKKWATTKHTEHTKAVTDEFQFSTANPPAGTSLNEGVSANRKSEIVNHKLALAWAGNSLGAQRQLSFLVRHPERTPVALVRLNGGRVEELRTQGKHSTFNAQRSTSNAGEPTPDPSEEGNGKEESERGKHRTFNAQHSTLNIERWETHP